jgi:hypothetical protein
MWNTACVNQLCFHKDKTNEQNLHLARLFCIRPQVNTTRPFVPKFLEIRAPQKEKKKQIQAQINKDNNILNNKIIEVFLKNSKYSQQPKKEYPAFRRYSNLKYEDIIRLSNIALENIKFENKINNLRPTYEYGKMRKEAEKQEIYLNNLLNRPKSIPFTPSLNFISIEQLHNRLKKQLIRQQLQFLNEERINTVGKNMKRRNSTSQMRTNTNNNSKINKNNGEKNKSGNKANRSQSSKNIRPLAINPDIQIENIIDDKNKDKKSKKETTTKCNTLAQK